MKRSESLPWYHSGKGLWCKKHRGRFYYFGSDRDEAMRRYRKEWDAIIAGKPAKTKRPIGNATVKEIGDEFLAAKWRKVEAGELTSRHYTDLIATGKAVVAHFGRSTPVADLSPSDFASLREAIAKRYGPVALGNFVQRVRSMFKHAFDAELIPVPVRFGPEFVRPPRRAVRAARKDKMIDAATLRKLLKGSYPPMKAFVLLGINCGFGQSDLAALPRSALARPGWVVFPRPKTGAARRCPLWPETAKAIEEARALGRVPNDDADAGLVFITEKGKRFVRDRCLGVKGSIRSDGVAISFKNLQTRLGLSGFGFYALRHTHRTIADGAKDQPAADLIMGHADQSMAGKYREGIEDERLKAVTDHVRKWLFG